MIYMDRPFHWYGKRFKWAHLWADDVKKLHRFAAKIGVKRCWFQNKRGSNFPHYDLTGSKITKARLCGARGADLREWRWALRRCLAVRIRGNEG